MDRHFIERKLLSVLIFTDLFKMQTKLPMNYKKAKKTQDKRVRKLVRRAYEIPFYKERFDSVGVKPSDIKEGKDLAKLPLLTKAELREWMNEEAKKPGYESWYHDCTSGSTGNPMMILFSPREKAYNMANWFRVMLLYGYNPFFGKTMSPVSTHSQSGSQTTFLQKIGILRRQFIDNQQSEEDIIKQINEYKPDFLYSNKSTLMKIALYAKKNNIELHKPKWFCPTGEMLDTNAVNLLREAFGGMLVDSYGTTETGSVLTRKNGEPRYVTNTESFVMNIYDENDELSDSGRIVVTPLYLVDLPIINYVIGDSVKGKYEGEELVVTEVQGRLNDLIKHKNGKVTSYFEINKLLGEFHDIVQLRFIQKSYELLHIQCVKNQDVDTPIEEIEKRFTYELNQRFREPMEIEYEWMDVIPPDANGKLRTIISEV